MGKTVHHILAIAAFAVAAPTAAFSQSGSSPCSQGNWHGCWGGGWEFTTSEPTEKTVVGDAKSTIPPPQPQQANAKQENGSRSGKAVYTPTSTATAAQENGSRSGTAAYVPTPTGVVKFIDSVQRGAPSLVNAKPGTVLMKNAKTCTYTNGKWNC